MQKRKSELSGTKNFVFNSIPNLKPLFLIASLGTTRVVINLLTTASVSILAPAGSDFSGGQRVKPFNFSG